MNENTHLAYEMYMQGIPHKQIGEELGFGESYSRGLIRTYAHRNNLPYPRPTASSAKMYAYCVNGMLVRDIARLYGLSENTIYQRLKDYCNDNLLESPVPTKERAKTAYLMRTRYNFSYAKIARMVGYDNRQNCFRAIKQYKEENQC